MCGSGHGGDVDFNTLKRKAVESAVRAVNDERLRDIVARATEFGTKAVADARQLAAAAIAQAEAASAEMVDDTKELKERLDRLRQDRDQR